MFDKFSHQIIAKDSKLFPERKARIFEFLRSHPVGVLSMVTPEGSPHGSVVYFAVGADQSIGFITKKLTRKYRNLTNDNQVTLTCYEATSQTTVSVVANAQEVHDAFELNAIAGAVMGASLKTGTTGNPPVTKIKAGAFTAFKLVPSKLYMAVYNKPGRSYDEIFESAESFELQDEDAA